MKKFAIASLILPSLVIGLVIASSASSNGSTTGSAPVPLEAHKILYIGGANPLFNSVMAKVRGLGVLTNQLDPTILGANNTQTQMLVADSLIIDGEWMGAQSNDIATQKMLSAAAFQGVKLVSIGGSSSKFFEALDKAGVNRLSAAQDGTVRNPAYFNPPMVGFAMKPSTSGSAYGSILISNTNNVDTLVQALRDWL